MTDSLSDAGLASHAAATSRGGRARNYYNYGITYLNLNRPPAGPAAARHGTADARRRVRPVGPLVGTPGACLPRAVRLETSQ
jgi:hypothetical protein